jgi:hypothetical protein
MVRAPGNAELLRRHALDLGAFRGAADFDGDVVQFGAGRALRAEFVTRGLDPRVHLLRKKMDGRG